MKEFDDTHNTANYLGVKYGWLKKARMNGGGPPFIKMGRLVRYKKSEVDRWVEERIKLNTLTVSF